MNTKVAPIASITSSGYRLLNPIVRHEKALTQSSAGTSVPCQVLRPQRCPSATLSTLPPELLRQITARLSLCDLYRLRGLCRGLCRAASELFLKRVASRDWAAFEGELLLEERGSFRVTPAKTACHLDFGPLRPFSVGRLLRRAGFAPQSQRADEAISWFMEESAAAAGRVAIGLGMTEDEVAEEAVRRFFVLQECDDQKDIARLSDLAQKMRIFVRHAGFPDGDALVWKMVEAAWTTAETYDHFGSGYALTVLLHGSDLLSWCREELASGARRFYKWAGICGSEALTGFTRSLMWMAYAVDGIEYRDIGRFLALTEDLQLADKVLQGALAEANEDAARALFDAIASEPLLLCHAVVHVLLRNPSLPGIDLQSPLGPLGSAEKPIAEDIVFAERFAALTLQSDPPRENVEAFVAANGLRGAPVWKEVAAAVAERARRRGIEAAGTWKLEELLS